MMRALWDVTLLVILLLGFFVLKYAIPTLLVIWVLHLFDVL